MGECDYQWVTDGMECARCGSAMTLIQMDSVRYKRRLAKELAGQIDGFYVGGKRYRLARVRGADLQIRALGEDQDWQVLNPLTDYPVDAYGRDICASLLA